MNTSQAASSSGQRMTSNMGSSSRGHGQPTKWHMKTAQQEVQVQTTAQLRFFQQVNIQMTTQEFFIKEQDICLDESTSLGVNPVQMRIQKSRFKWYHRIFTVESVLRDILMCVGGDIRNQKGDRDQVITQGDLECIINCCLGNWPGVIASREKCREMGFRTLYFLTQNRFGKTGLQLQRGISLFDTSVSEKAISMLVANCVARDSKTLPYAIMTLGFTICHDPKFFSSIEKLNIESIFAVLNLAIDFLWSLQPQEYFEAILIAIAAKAKLTNHLSEGDIKKIELGLSDLQKVYNKRVVSVKNSPHSEYLSALKTRKGIIEGIRKHVLSPASNSLSERELAYIVDSFHKTNNQGTRHKILEIIHGVVLKKQIAFPNPKGLISVLTTALNKKTEFRLRSKALVVANTLVFNRSTFDAYKGIRDHIISARQFQYFYALTALDQYLTILGSTKLPHPKRWTVPLRAIAEEKKNHEVIRKLAGDLTFQIEHNPSEVVKFLDLPEYCVRATAMILKRAINQRDVQLHVLLHLEETLLKQKNRWPEEAIINALGVFRYMAAKIEDSSDIFLYATNIICIDPSFPSPSSSTSSPTEAEAQTLAFRLREAALFFIGESLLSNRNQDHFELALVGVMISIKYPALIEGTCFVLKKWIEGKDFDPFQSLFDQLFDEFIRLLYSEISFDSKMLIANVLKEALFKHYQFSPEWLKQFGDLLPGLENTPLLQDIVQIIFTILSRMDTIKRSDTFYSNILNRLESEDDALILAEGAILTKYIKILDQPLDSPQLDQLVKLTNSEKTQLLGIEVFQLLVEKKQPFNEHCFSLFILLISQGRGLILHSASLLLKGACEYQPLPESVFEDVIELISLSEDDVVTICLDILSQNMGNLENISDRVLTDSIAPLVSIATDRNYDFNIRSNAFAFLYKFSEKTSKCFAFKHIKQLMKCLVEQDQLIRLSALNQISSQLEFFRIHVKNANPFIKEVIASMEAYLDDELLSREAVKVVCTLSGFGQALSLETRNRLANRLYYDCDDQVVRSIYRILEKYKSALEGTSRNVFLIHEKLTTLVDDSTPAQVKLNAMQILIQSLEQGVRMTPYVDRVIFSTVGKLDLKKIHPNSYTQKMIGLAILFCRESLRNRLKLSQELLKQLCELKFLNLSEDNLLKRGELFVDCILDNTFIDHDGFRIVEELFNNNKNNVKIDRMIVVLDIAIRNGFVLNIYTIKKIYDLLFKDKEENRIFYCDLLIQFLDSDNRDTILKCISFDQVWNFFERCASKDLKDRIILFIYNLSCQIELSSIQKRKIEDKVRSFKEFNFQWEHCQMLRPHLKRGDIHSKCPSLFQFKERERELLLLAETCSPENFTAEVMRAIVDLSTRLEEQFSDDFFLAILPCIEKITLYQRNKFINSLLTLAYRQPLPDFIIGKLLSVPSEHLLRIIELLHHELSFERELGKKTVTGLVNIILENSERNLRASASRIIMQIDAKFHSVPTDVLTMIRLGDSQYEGSEKEWLVNLRNHVNGEGRLSYEHVLKLLEFLKGRWLNNHRSNAIRILDIAKARIPRPLYRDIILSYFEMFFVYPEKRSYFINFITYTIENKIIERGEAQTFLIQLCNELQDRDIIPSAEFGLFDLLVDYTQHPIEIGLIIKLIDSILFISEEKFRDQVIYRVFRELSQLSGWPQGLLSHLNPLISHVFSIPTSELESPQPATSESVFDWFSSGLTKLKELVVEKPPIAPIPDEKWFFISNYLHYIIEDERSQSYFDKIKTQISTSCNSLVGDFIDSIDSSDDLDIKRQFRASLGRIEGRLTTNEYRRLLRLLVIKQHRNHVNLAELTEMISIFNELGLAQLKRDYRDLIFRDLVSLRNVFILSLISPFPSLISSGDEEKRKIFAVCLLLQWPPHRLKRLMTTLATGLQMSELVKLVTLIHSFCLDEEFIAGLLAPHHAHELLASNLTDVLMRLLLLRELEGYSTRLWNSLYDIINDELPSSWIELVLTSSISLCKRGWEFNRLFNWIQECADLSRMEDDRPFLDLRSLSYLLSMACDYREQIREEEFHAQLEVCKKHGAILTPDQLHDKALNLSSVVGVVKELPELIREVHCAQVKQREEIKKLLGSTPSFQLNVDHILYVSCDQIEACMKQMKICYEGINRGFSIHGSSLPIREWDDEQINQWAFRIKERLGGMSTSIQYPSSSSSQSRNEDFARSVSLREPSLLESGDLPEYLAVISRACELKLEMRPREVQLVALIILCGGGDPDILAQISTGEGKSLIIAMLAVVKALQGRSVDIITSSPVLAKRDAEKHKDFFACFNLGVSSNEDHRYTSGLKKCYAEKNQIIYGDPSHFQFDYLRTHYSGLKTKGSRECEVVIIDEVDNVLVEGNDTVAMLASPMPGMHELNPLLIQIWHKLCDLDYSIRSNPDNANCDMDSVIRELSQFITDIVPKGRNIMIPSHLVIEEKNEVIQIPNHLVDFVLSQKEVLATSAYLAFYVYKLDHHYIIKNNHEGVKSIVPVDYSNTGGIQDGTSWGDGLHQFLQIKHSLEIESLSLVTNFLSIRAYIDKYKERVGMTGTLGSPQIRNLINRNHQDNQFKFVEIPTHFLTKKVQLQPLILNDYGLWLEAIALSAVREASLMRVVLVICETIEVTKELESLLKKKFLVKPLMYFDDKSELNDFIEKVHSGNSIILATNLAGRGTDIKITREVVQRGGLHVCLTFLPLNGRVTDQAFGRASRKGDPGTMQMVLNEDILREAFPEATDHEFEQLEIDSELIFRLRDKEEAARLDKIISDRLPELALKDKLFSQFLEFLREIDKLDQSNQSSIIPHFKDKVDDRVTGEPTYIKELHKVKRSALEERWGLWLKSKQFETDEKMVLKSFELFKMKMENAYHDNSIIGNAHYWIRLGNNLLSQVNRLYRVVKPGYLLRQAEYAYNRAIDLDEKMSYIAYYYRAYVCIRRRKNKYRTRAKADLEKMIASLDRLIVEIEKISLRLNVDTSIHSNKSNNIKYKLLEQLQVYYHLKDSAERAIEQINQSNRLIEVEASVPCYSQISAKKYLEEDLLEKIEMMKLVGSGIDAASHPVTITFNDLTTNEDLWTNSQLLNTVRHVFKGVEKRSSKITCSISFPSQEMRTALNGGLRMLLPINRRGIKPMSEAQTEDNTQRASSSNQGPSIECVSFGDHVKKIVKPVKKFGVGIADGLQKFGMYLEEKANIPIDHTRDWWHEYKPTESIKVSLKFTGMPLGFVSSLTKNELFTDDQKFSIGPIKINDGQCEELIQISNNDEEITISIWNRNQSESQPISSKLVKLLKDTTLLPLAEITVQSCSKKTLIALLKLIASSSGSASSSHNLLTCVLHDLDQKKADEYLKSHDGNATLMFEGLDGIDAEKISKLTIDYHRHAKLHFQTSGYEEAAIAIKKADRVNQHLILKRKDIRKELSLISNEPIFFRHYQNNGLIFLYGVEEQLPMPYKSLALLAVIGTAEIAGGIALTTLTVGFGASVGQGLITEGILDGTRFLAVLSERQFKLRDFFIQKVVSMSLLLLSAGLSNLNTARNIGQAGRKIVNLKAITKDVSMMGEKAGSELSNVLPKLVVKAATEATKKGAKLAIHAGFRQLLTILQPKIEKSTRSVIDVMFNRLDWENYLDKLFALDAFLGWQSNLDNLIGKAREIVFTAQSGVYDLGGVLSTEALAQFEQGFNTYLADSAGATPRLIALLAQKLKLVNLKEQHREAVKELFDKNIVSESGVIDIEGLTNLIGSDAHGKLSVGGRGRRRGRARMLNQMPNQNIARNEILQTCLTYAQLQCGDYYYQKRKLVDAIVELFFESYFNGIKTILEIPKALCTGVSNAACSATGDCVISSLEETNLKELSELNPTTAGGPIPQGDHGHASNAGKTVGRALTRHKFVNHVKQSMHSSVLKKGGENFKLKPTGFSLRMAFGKGGVITAGVLMEIMKSEYQRQQQILHNLEKSILAAHFVSQASILLSSYDDIMRAQIAVINIIIGYLLIELSKDESGNYIPMETEKFDDEIAVYFRESLRLHHARQDPVLPIFKNLINSNRQSIIQEFLKRLEEAWRKFGEIEAQKERESFNIDRFVFDPCRKPVCDAIVGMIKLNRYFEMGEIFEKENLSMSSKVFVIVYKIFTTTVSDYAKIKTCMIRENAIVKMMALSLVHRTLMSFASIQEAALDIAVQRMELTGHVSSNQADLAEKIQLKYSHYLNDLLTIIFEERGSIMGNIKIDMLKKAFNKDKDSINQEADAKARAFITQDFESNLLRETMRQAGEIVLMMIEVVERHCNLNQSNRDKECQGLISQIENFSLPEGKPLVPTSSSSSSNHS